MLSVDKDGTLRDGGGKIGSVGSRGEIKDKSGSKTGDTMDSRGHTFDEKGMPKDRAVKKFSGLRLDLGDTINTAISTGLQSLRTLTTDYTEIVSQLKYMAESGLESLGFSFKRYEMQGSLIPLRNSEMPSLNYPSSRRRF
jgi:hypothetical protein